MRKREGGTPDFVTGSCPYALQEMKDAYLKHKDLNVIIVDWTGGNSGLYESAVANTRVVGAEIALLVRKFQVKSVFRLRMTWTAK